MILAGANHGHALPGLRRFHGHSKALTRHHAGAVEFVTVINDGNMSLKSTWVLEKDSFETPYPPKLISVPGGCIVILSVKFISNEIMSSE